jgi:HlyD family secretion protein
MSAFDSASTDANGRGAGSRRQPRGGAIHRTVAALWAHRWFLLVALVLAALGAYQGARILLGPAVVVDRATSGALVETVVATGNVQTPYRVPISSQITGAVSDVLVDEGQQVTKGQPLITLEDSELKAAASQAQGALAEAEARMKQLRELTLPTARETQAEMKAGLLDAQQTYDRTDSLVKTGAATRASLDDARKALDVARAQANATDLAVYTASPGGSDYVLAETQINQAHANLQTANARLGYALISAPRDGVLITRNVEKGAVAVPGAALLVLAPTGTTQIELQIDERNLGKIALGQKAQASADAYPDDRFEAVISYINPGIDITRGSVEVKLDVPSPPTYLRQDMTVSVDVESARREHALILPARSVRDALSGEPWVMTIRDGRAFKQPVKLGLHGQNQFEIVDGLAAGDLAVPAASGLLTGQRVRPVVQ